MVFAKLGMSLKFAPIPVEFQFKSEALEKLTLSRKLKPKTLSFEPVLPVKDIFP